MLIFSLETCLSNRLNYTLRYCKLFLTIVVDMTGQGHTFWTHSAVEILWEAFYLTILALTALESRFTVCPVSKPAGTDEGHS